MSPGVTARPRRSIRRVAGPASCVDLLVGADRDDALALDGDRLRDREPLVDGDDLAVGEDESGAVCCARVSAPAQKMARTTPAATLRTQRVKVGRT